MNIKDKIQKDIALKPFTTWQVGGAAKYYLEIKSKDDLSAAYFWAKDKQKKIYILGGGSNILVPDNGVDGLVLRMLNDKIEVKGERLECGAGAGLSSAIIKATGNNLSGLEWASGIPRATIGGSIRGNAGAFGQRMADLVETIEAFYIKTKKFIVFSNRDCKFIYRSSVFKEKADYLVWSATLRLHKEKPETIRARIEESLSHRVRRYPKLPGVGSIFKNLDPLDIEKGNPMLMNELKDKIGRTGKISAGLLIDMCGLKGKTIGGVKVSLEHANHLVNTGHARAEEIVMLISYIKQQVRDKFAIELQEEIQYFGFE
ncbi:UDP-N-acetylmuramate dehydrogenase [Candidatus Parcubacteria bacterium]|nr:UDP-N-acetylmuramate dehydrogenase [Candidatus Parcubacteria bacterium]